MRYAPRWLVLHFVVLDRLGPGQYSNCSAYFENDEIRYVFDWEKTAVRSRYHELIRSMDYMCLNNGVTKKDFENAKYYLESYKKIYDFDISEFNEALLHYYYLKSHESWVINEHYLYNNTKVDLFLKPYSEGIEYFYVMRERFVEDFI